MSWERVGGCYLCSLSVADAIVLGTMMGALLGEDDSGLAGIPGRRPIQVCPAHVNAIEGVDKGRMARMASMLTGREIHVQPTPRWLR